MKTLLFRNTDNTLRVEYITNLIGDNITFTVMKIIGLDDAEVVLGISFRELVYTLPAFKTFATNNNLILDEYTVSTITNLIAATELAVTTVSLAGGNDSVAYDEDLTDEGGNGPHVWSLAAGALPDGLTLTAAGKIAGTPTVVDTFEFTVQVNDSFTLATKVLSIVIGA